MFVPAIRKQPVVPFKRTLMKEDGFLKTKLLSLKKMFPIPKLWLRFPTPPSTRCILRTIP